METANPAEAPFWYLRTLPQNFERANLSTTSQLGGYLEHCERALSAIRSNLATFARRRLEGMLSKTVLAKHAAVEAAVKLERGV